jgi:hypothetical protein
VIKIFPKQKGNLRSDVTERSCLLLAALPGHDGVGQAGDGDPNGTGKDFGSIGVGAQDPGRPSVFSRLPDNSSQRGFYRLA